MEYICYIRIAKYRISRENEERNTSFYVIEHIFRKHFVSLQRYKIKERCKTRFPKRGEHKKMRIMKKNANEIFMLQYQIKRYQAMGNGTMCQTLNGKLQKLLAKQPLVTM